MALMMNALNTVILLLYTVIVSRALGKETCSDPLGMENKTIKDSQITVSSIFFSSNSGKSARLRKIIPLWGAWCPNITNAEKEKIYYDEYIKIDLLHLTTITKVATQGREFLGGREFVKTYQISYSYDNRKWMYYREKSSDVKNFIGNTDANTVVESKIVPPIVARYVRIHPGYKLAVQVCLRLELYGCLYKGILSYSIPQGDTTKNGMIKYEDTIYNGVVKNGILYDGTGLLTDGEIGPVNSTEYNGKGWVGWNRTFSEQDGVDITFEFNWLQKFNDVSIVININNEHGNVLFNNSRILFSPTAYGFSGSSALQYFPKQLQLQTLIGNVNVKLPLCGNIAKFVRIQLYPGRGWILLSEIKFNSDPVLAADPTVFKTCSGSGINVCHSTETSSAHLLSIVIGLVCVFSLFCVIGVVILALLLTRGKVQQPTRNDEVPVEMHASPVLNNGNDDIREPPSSLTQTPNNEENQPEEEDEIEESSEYPSRPESGCVIPAQSTSPAPEYSSLITPAPDEDEHQYQGLL